MSIYAEMSDGELDEAWRDVGNYIGEAAAEYGECEAVAEAEGEERAIRAEWEARRGVNETAPWVEVVEEEDDIPF